MLPHKLNEGYGGIYTNQIFHPNPKCLLISFFIVGIAMFAPRTILFAVILFILIYILIAWYDKLYGCSPTMKSGKYDIKAPMKPQDNVLPPDEQYKQNKKMIYLFHMTIVTALLFYSSYVINTQLPDYKGLSTTLGVVGAGALTYHGYRFFTSSSVNYKKTY